MANYTIDRSVEFLLGEGQADDAAFRGALGVDSIVRVHSEHILAKAATALELKSQELNNGYIALSYSEIHFVLLRAVDLTNLKASPARILLRPHTLSKALAALTHVGGLALAGVRGFRAMLKEVARAAASMEALKIGADDVFELPEVGSGTWHAHVTIGMLTSAGSPSGRVYAQFRATFGNWVKDSDLDGVDFKGLLALLQPLTGDLSAHGPPMQARMVAHAFQQTAISDLFDFIPDDIESELIRRASADRFTPLFNAV